MAARSNRLPIAIAGSLFLHALLLASLRGLPAALTTSELHRSLTMETFVPKPPPEPPRPEPPTPFAVRTPPRPKSAARAPEKPVEAAPETKEVAPREGPPSEPEAPPRGGDRAPTPGPAEPVEGRGPAAGNGTMLGADFHQGSTAARAGAPEGQGRGIGSPQAKSDLQGYHRNIYRAVNAAQRYPAEARRLGLQGRAVLAVRIDRAGKLLGKPRLVESTKHEVLDEEAFRMIESAAPFPPLPASYDAPEAEFMIPIKFALRD